MSLPEQSRPASDVDPPSASAGVATQLLAHLVDRDRGEIAVGGSTDSPGLAGEVPWPSPAIGDA
jgi:hypothetical protein